MKFLIGGWKSVQRVPILNQTHPTILNSFRELELIIGIASISYSGWRIPRTNVVSPC